jgi:pilus assembly protein Flp/PilA
MYIPPPVEAAQVCGVCGQEFWMLQLISRFLSDESGATAIEYCLIAVGLSIVIVTAVNGIGSTLNTNFSSINTSLK